MASLARENNGWRLQVMLPDRSRKSIRLGSISRGVAERFKEHVERIVGCIKHGHQLDPETAAWAAKLPDPTYAKLVNLGLLAPRKKAEAITLAAFIDAYIEGRRGAAASRTISFWQISRRNLVEFFGADRLLTDISPGEADEFRIWLRKKVSENSTNRRVGHAKQFFRAAVRRRILAENPFADLTGAVKPSPEKFFFVDRETAKKVADACPSAEWRGIFALARFGGLRIPSELVGLTWADVDWERSRIRVTSPKTAHHGKSERIIPLFPELVEPLQTLFDRAAEGEVYVIPMASQSVVNFRSSMRRIVRAAGVVLWPKVFQNLRSSRETELCDSFPLQTACQWLGNTAAIAAKHYLQVRNADFERATRAAAAEIRSESAHSQAVPDDFDASQANATAEKCPENAQYASVSTGGEVNTRCGRTCRRRSARTSPTGPRRPAPGAASRRRRGIESPATPA